MRIHIWIHLLAGVGEIDWKGLTMVAGSEAVAFEDSTPGSSGMPGGIELSPRGELL